jgi:hypothetical protein
MPNTARNVFGIILLVISGFNFYAVALLSFIHKPLWPIKMIVVSLFAIPAVGFLLVGVWCHGFAKFRRDFGIVLLSAAGVTAMAVFSYAAMLATPGYAKLVSPEERQVFSAVWTGGIWLALYVVVGLALILRRKSAARE